MKYCLKCGEQHDDKATFCRACGNREFAAKLTHIPAPIEIPRKNSYISTPEEEEWADKGFTVENGELLCYTGKEKDVVIPDGIKRISPDALSFNEKIESVTVPEGVEVLNRTFEDCVNLKSVKLPKSLKFLDRTFDGCESLEDIALPEGLRAIGSGTFAGCAKIEELIIPRSVVKISDDVAAGANALKRVILGGVTPKLDEYAFAKEVEVLRPEPAATIVCDNPDFEFDGATLVNYLGEEEEVTVPEGVLVIGELAFSNYITKDKLKRVILPDGLQLIDEGAFMECKNLESIQIPDTVCAVEGSAFADCASLKKVVLPELCILGDCVFSRCESLTDINLSAAIKMGILAFNGCTSLQSAALSLYLNSVSGSAFTYCVSLRRVDIPRSVTRLGDYAFSFCESLDSVYIPSSVLRMGANVFEGCTALGAILCEGQPESSWHKNWNVKRGLIIKKRHNVVFGAKKSI